MGLNHSPQVVRDGLVLYFDAANTKSYGSVPLLGLVDVLVVGGGGAGGQDFAGGGGAGGLIYSRNYSIIPGTNYTVTVGAGGQRPTTSGQIRSGGNSVFGALTAIGGGAGTGSAVGAAVGPNGGSGGGGGANYPAGTGTDGQGYAGATTVSGVGGGGGGSGGPGLTNGTGGPGLQIDISGTPTWYAAGGAGGNSTGFPYYGGSGIGGSAYGIYQDVRSNGVDGTGSGGAGYYGSWGGAGNGGSGIVVIRYLGPVAATGGTITSVNGYTIHTFTTSGTFTPNIKWGDLCEYRNYGLFINAPSFNSIGGGNFVFNGSSDSIIIPENAALNTQTPTVEVWVKTNATTQNGFWFEKGNVNTQYALFQEGANITWRHTTNVGSLTAPAASYMNTSQYAQVVGTYTAGDRRIYVNGVQVASDALSYTLPTNANGASIGVYGGYNGVRGYYYNGNIAVVKVYNRALTATEIKQNFNALRGRFGL